MRFEVSGHHIWGKWTSNHPENIPQSEQSHLNGFWKNRDLKLTILGIFWPKKAVKKARLLHITELLMEFILETIYMVCVSKGLNKRQQGQQWITSRRWKTNLVLDNCLSACNGDQG